MDGVASSYLVDAQGGLPTLVDDGSKAYLHAGGLLGEIGGGTRYALGDALGSVRGLADDAGSLVGTASYEAFGATRASSGASSLFGFTGEPTDATGLVYLRARTLDPATGRFLSADSVIPNAPGTSGYNLYAYAGNDPTTWTDPTGHQVLAPADAAQRLLDFYKAVPAAALLEFEYLVAGGALETASTGIGAMAVAIIGIIVAAVLIWYLLEILPNKRWYEFGSPSGQGIFGQAIQDLLEAPTGFPPAPAAPGTATGPSASDSPYPFREPLVFPLAEPKYEEHRGEFPWLDSWEEYEELALALASGGAHSGPPFLPPTRCQRPRDSAELLFFESATGRVYVLIMKPLQGGHGWKVDNMFELTDPDRFKANNCATIPHPA